MPLRPLDVIGGGWWWTRELVGEDRESRGYYFKYWHCTLGLATFQAEIAIAIIIHLILPPLIVLVEASQLIKMYLVLLLIYKPGLMIMKKLFI